MPMHNYLSQLIAKSDFLVFTSVLTVKLIKKFDNGDSHFSKKQRSWIFAIPICNANFVFCRPKKRQKKGYRANAIQNSPDWRFLATLRTSAENLLFGVHETLCLFLFSLMSFFFRSKILFAGSLTTETFSSHIA